MKHQIRIFLNRHAQLNIIDIRADDYTFHRADELNSVYDWWEYTDENGYTTTVKVKPEVVQAVITNTREEDAQDGQES